MLYTNLNNILHNKLNLKILLFTAKVTTYH